MAKPKISYACQNCGAVHPRWSGHCDACGGWNTITEEIQSAAPVGSLKAKGPARSNVVEFVDLKGQNAPLPRASSGIGEWDRVTGGGLVPGSVTLIGGDPGIGKSTLLLQLVAALAQKNLTCAYISGEEAIDQVRLRARRLGLEQSPVHLASATSVRDIVSTLEPQKGQKNPYDLVVIDSIQTMFVDTIESAPGTVGQVRATTSELIRLAKTHNITVLIVGHVTKEGTIAGPRVLEHMVDTVLYFEGDRGHQFRILRGVKNRFGPTDEIGVFEMGGKGLAEVPNPSALFLAERRERISGSAVLAALEGTRPVLVEVQALVAPTTYSAPKRAVVGYDSNRLSMILAVLEARCGIMFSGQDVYLNIAGGLKIAEPAADLAVAAALCSALSGIAISGDAIIFGEIGLSGEIRPVPQPDLRLKEAEKLGFKSAYIPQGKSKPSGHMDCHSFTTLDDFVRYLRG
ncbi:MAG: DNA repair protein RadA [Alphaproteobacteria bacterium]|nr:DNA repair protein RadA [Alphaproteobacteria bacterium]